MNDYIFISGKIYNFSDRKCSKIKQAASPDRSLNGTLSIDILSNSIKKEWTFTFYVDERQLVRLESIWSKNITFPFIDWDNSQSTVACTSSSFTPFFIGFDQDDSPLYSISLDFKEV